MKLYVYQVEKIDDYRNMALTIDYDYSEDFEAIKRARGYYKNDYYITDTPDLKPSEVYFTGDLIKIVKKITEFEGENIQTRFNR